MEKEEFVKLINEYLHQTRKLYGMCSQIGWRAYDLSKNAVYFQINVDKNSPRRDEFGNISPREVIIDIKNASLSQLGDLLPLEYFRGVYKDDLKNFYTGFKFDFYNPKIDEFLLATSAIPIIDIVLEHRNEYMERFKEGMRRLK